MDVVLYCLREAGRPLSYAEVKARPRPKGRLVLGTWGNPEMHAKLFGAWPDKSAPQLNHARVMRVSNGCMLLLGFQWQPSIPYPRQAWLCALNEEVGEAALRRIRPPKAVDLPLGEWDDDGPE